jgi:hypothetical protein
MPAGIVAECAAVDAADPRLARSSGVIPSDKPGSRRRRFPPVMPTPPLPVILNEVKDLVVTLANGTRCLDRLGMTARGALAA